MSLVLLPIDQDTENAVAQQLACWAKTATGMINPRVVYQTCCASVTGATVGRYQIPPDLCGEYGPLPFTSGGEPIPCDSESTVLRPFVIYSDDVDPIDPNTCESGDEPLPAPVGLAASEVTDNSFTLSWDTVDGGIVLFTTAEAVRVPEARARLYVVEFSADGGQRWERLSITEPPLVLDGLKEETTYLVRVAAATRASEQRLNWSDPITVTTKTPTPRIDLTWEPDRRNVFGVQVTATGADQITLDFGDGVTKRTITGGQTVNHVYASAGTYTITAS